MSKQYLTAHVAEQAHPSDIFALAITPKYVLSAAGDSNIKLWQTTASNSEHPLVHTFSGAHRLGVHHVVASRDGRVAASAGFGGETLVWDLEGLKRVGKIEGQEAKEAGEVWAIALSPNGELLASTTYDGRINIWNTGGNRSKVRQYETKGSFGMCVDISADGKFVASGHENGGIYIFNNETGRIYHSLPGLVKPIRSIAFSPAGKLLAAAGDSNVIALYDVVSGEQVANLTGHSSWIFSIAWSSTGEYLLSGSFDGKAKVWSTGSKSCVATHSETDKALYAVKWIPKGPGVGEGFVTAGANQRISFYREATGG